MAMSQNPLGRNTEYPSSYNPDLLFPIARDENRRRIGLAGSALPFRGYDLWRAYEISWLDLRGKPVVAAGEILVPAETPCMVESKSFKLYLNSLNHKSFDSADAVQQLMADDLARVLQARCLVQLYMPLEFSQLHCVQPEGESLDELPLDIDVYQPDSSLLRVEAGCLRAETLYSNLFRSNCPVTAQPDWGTAVIRYKGNAVDHASLLRYLVSYRQHNGFHEDCVERIYVDLMQKLNPECLSVAINFLRRGGLEINPVRSSHPFEMEFPAVRLSRQ
jgi:7-cyano-7-deazaguanine reductase